MGIHVGTDLNSFALVHSPLNHMICVYIVVYGKMEMDIYICFVIINPLNWWPYPNRLYS